MKTTLIGVAATLPIAFLLAGAAPAVAQGFELTVTIDRVSARDCLDPVLFWCNAADFYPRVTIAGERFTANDVEGDTITPGWAFSRFVASGSVNVAVEIWDADGGLRFGDDHVDLTPGSGRTLNFAVDPTGCTISGGVSGSCGGTLISAGTSGDRAEIRLTVTVRAVRLGEIEVVIERLTALDSLDFLSAADFFARVEIDGVEQSNRNLNESNRLDGDDDIAPYWRFTRFVDLSRPSVNVDIRIFDEDGGLFNGSDDTIDVSPTGRHLNLRLTGLTAPSCTISGEASGRCGDVLDVPARLDTSGASSGRARMQARIQVFPRARGYIRCVHDPIWPARGDSVTFRADVLDANMRPIAAQAIRLRQPANAATAGRVCTDTSSCSVSLGASAEGRFDYACEADVAGFALTTGARTSSIGNPGGARAIPILRHHADTDRAMDLVFLHDSGTYSSASTTSFKDDVFEVIRDAYYDFELYLRNQHRINFWIGLDAGQANGFGGSAPCLVVPGNFTTTYAFADAGVILHTDNLRDCATGRAFSSEPDSFRTVRHETGHRPFGLADEYCCDGGYFQTGVNPNMFGPQAAGSTAGLTACNADPLGALRGSCGGFTSTRVSSGSMFFRLDHAPVPGSAGTTNDLMVDNWVPRAADERRIQAIFDALP